MPYVHIGFGCTSRQDVDAVVAFVLIMLRQHENLVSKCYLISRTGKKKGEHMATFSLYKNSLNGESAYGRLDCCSDPNVPTLR